MFDKDTNCANEAQTNATEGQPKKKALDLTNVMYFSFFMV